MKATDFLLKLGEVDKRYVNEAIEYKHKKRFINNCNKLAVAACLGLFMAAILLLPLLSSKDSMSSIFAYNKLDQHGESASKYIPGYFTENLNEENFESLLPYKPLDWMEFSGFAGFNGGGEIIEVFLTCTNMTWGSTTSLYISKGSFVPDYTLPENPVSSEVNGIQVIAYQYADSDEIVFEASFMKNGNGFFLSTSTESDKLAQAKSDFEDIILCYTAEETIINLDALTPKSIPDWKAEDLTLDDAIHDPDFGFFVPESVPEGFNVEVIVRHINQAMNYLQALWYHGEDSLFWKVSYLGTEDKVRITSVEAKENYDLTLYPAMDKDFVPDNQIIENPIFKNGELTLDIVKAREYKIQTTEGAQVNIMHFSVVYENILVEVKSKGIAPEWLFEQLSLIRE